MDQIDMALPLCSGGIMSAMHPLPHVSTATPKKPAKKRKASIMPASVATAHATEKKTNMVLPTWKTGIRP